MALSTPSTSRKSRMLRGSLLTARSSHPPGTHTQGGETWSGPVVGSRRHSRVRAPRDQPRRPGRADQHPRLMRRTDPSETTDRSCHRYGVHTPLCRCCEPATSPAPSAWLRRGPTDMTSGPQDPSRRGRRSRGHPGRFPRAPAALARARAAVNTSMPAPPSGTAPRGRRHEGHGAQVFARDMRVPPDAPLFYLDRGQADGVRADVNAGHLVCPIGDCPDPRFTVRGGSKRDGFAHRPGVHGHGPETVAHHTSKHLVAAWLRIQHPDAHLDVDTREIENGQRPDVTLTLPDGTVVAYEVQFAALEQKEWQHRHDGYQALGIRDVWIFGGKHYDRRPRRSSAEPDSVTVHPVFQSVLAAGHPMLLIDPWAETVALGTGPYSVCPEQG